MVLSFSIISSVFISFTVNSFIPFVFISCTVAPVMLALITLHFRYSTCQFKGGFNICKLGNTVLLVFHVLGGNSNVGSLGIGFHQNGNKINGLLFLFRQVKFSMFYFSKLSNMIVDFLISLIMCNSNSLLM